MVGWVWSMWGQPLWLHYTMLSNSTFRVYVGNLKHDDVIHFSWCHLGAISDGRLTVGITKFDILSADVENDINGIKDELKESTVKSILEATKETVHKSTIIPLCNKWALTASKLNGCSLRGIHNKERKEMALRTLEMCSGSLDIACGEGQTMGEAIRSEYKSGQDVVNALEKVSGIAELKTR